MAQSVVELDGKREEKEMQKVFRGSRYLVGE
jgi:hypothetical protein